MSEDKAHILVVDDDDRLRSLLKKFLRRAGVHGYVRPPMPQKRGARLAWFEFDLMVLDVMMPGESGLRIACVA